MFPREKSMRFTSTRNENQNVSFKQAVLDPMPVDGGLYVPRETKDLRHWIYYTNKNTTFANIAGTLTSAMINEEFSPIICETIATHAFPFEPELKKLDENLFVLELYHGPTGSSKDFGVSYLTSCLETILQMDGEKSILLDSTTGELGACMAHAMRGKKLLKSVLLYPKGTLRGLEESDYVWNGGNIYPVEIDGTHEDCLALIRKIFADRSLVEKYHLTVANTANIGRLLPQEFYYTYAFSRLKEEIDEEIYYALSAGNYSTIVAGLYSWQLSLPVNGFIVPETENLQNDVQGNCFLLDSFIPVKTRPGADPADPSNLERLEYLFKGFAPMLKSFVFPAPVSDAEADEACRTLFKKYHYFANRSVSSAYAASRTRTDCADEEGAVVLIKRHDEALYSDYFRRVLGEVPETSEKIKAVQRPVILNRPVVAANDSDQIISILNSLNLLRIF